MVNTLLPELTALRRNDAALIRELRRKLDEKEGLDNEGRLAGNLS
jgi:hypothetical protein